MRKLLLSLTVLSGAAFATAQAEAAPTGRLALEPATQLSQGTAVEAVQYRYRRPLRHRMRRHRLGYGRY